MPIEQQDVADARRAVVALDSAVQRLRRSVPDSVDLRRLTEDVARLQVDLDLLAGPAPSSGAPPGRDADRDPGYDPREFVDGTYEGASPRKR